MILSKVYEDAERRLERNEITLGEFERLVDIEVIELKRGEWIHPYHYGLALPEHQCSVCGEWENSDTESNFCPNCGADMRGKDDE